MRTITLKIWTLSTGCALLFLFGYRHFITRPDWDGQPARGVVEAIESDNSSLTLLVPKAHVEQSFTWNNATEFLKDHGKATDTAMHTGDRVTVEYATFDDRFVATKIVIHEVHGKHHKV